MVNINDDGMAVYDEDIVYFDNWLEVFHGSDSESIRAGLLGDFINEDEVDEHMNELEEQFYNYCEENDYVGETA